MLRSPTGFMGQSGRKIAIGISPFAIAFSLTMFSTAAFATDKIYSPIVVEKELEAEYSGSTTFDGDKEKDNLQVHEFEFEYGISDRVMLELNTELEKEPGNGLKQTGIGVGARFQFFEQGEYWLDAGLLAAYGKSLPSGNPDAIELKLLLEKQSGNFLHRANIGIEKEVGSHSSGSPDRVFLWNSRYRLNENFEPGFEIQSDFGAGKASDSFDKQEHYIGPALFGQIVPNLKYEAVYYFGVSKAASNGAARLLLEYESFF